MLRAAILAAIAVGCAAPARPADTVVYASGTDLESANPLVTIHSLSRQLQRYALFVTLARYDSALAAEPYYARSWSWSADRRELTLHLDPALRWHDGGHTTARDVAFTLDAARDPATGYPRYADLAALERVAVTDDTTLTLRFASPLAAFPAVLCELPILPAHLLSTVPRAEMRRAAFNTNPVGNGPFRFVSRTAGARWVFERFARFPASLGGAPRVGRLVVAVVDEPTTKFAGLVSGELDVAGIAPTMASLVRRDTTLRVLSYPVLVANALVFNVAKPPLDDARVRRAISASIDRRRIVSAALAGFATPATGPVPPDNRLAAPQPIPSPREADSLFDAAGLRRGADGRRRRAGTPLALTLLTVGSGDNAVEQLVQADLRARGVQLEIRQREMGAFLGDARAKTKAFDMLLTGIPGDLSLSYVAAMYDSRLAGGLLDYSGFHTPSLDSLFDRVRRARSAAEARDAWRAVQTELARDEPAAWIYYSRGVQGISRRLRGVSMDLRGELVSLGEWHVDTAPTHVARR